MTRALALALALAAAAPAQLSRNVSLLARVNPGGTFSDCWGHVAADGREYCLLCASDRVWVIDCTPPMPAIRGAILGSASGWQPSPWHDVVTFGQLAYVVTEGGAGMQIIDLADPDQPVLLSTFGQSHWSHAHSLAIDAAAGLLFVCGTDADTFVLDVKTDPTNPAVLGSFTLGGYIHELHAQHGLAYIADLRSNDLVIADVSAPPAVAELGRIAMPGKGLAHSAWATPDAAWCVTSNEVPGGPIAIFDVRNPRLPALASQVSLGPSTAIPHDPYERDRVLHASYYTEGYQVVDLSDAVNPIVVGWYDTFGGQSGGFNGAWGCYPFQPSGHVYVSDIVSGLWIFAPLAISTRYGQGTPGTAGATPDLRAHGCAWLGNPAFALDLERAAPSSSGALLLGSSAASVPVAGIQLLVDLTQTSVALDLTADATGHASLGLPIPSDPLLDGLTLYAQAVVLDAAAAQGLAATPGLRVAVFQR